MWSGIFMGKRYRLSEYVHAGTITMGCSIFILTGTVSAER